MATNVGTAFFLFWGLLRVVIYWARKVLITATLVIAVIVASLVGTSMYREMEYNKAARTCLAKGSEHLRFAASRQRRTSPKAGGEPRLRWANYQEAGVQFQKVINRYPKSKWVENALVGMGIVWEGSEDYGRAIEALKQVVKNYPDGNKAPDAQYGIGDIYESKLKDYERAIEAYQKVVDKYPQTEQARWAKLRVDSIKTHIAYRPSPLARDTSLRRSILNEVKGISRIAKEKGVELPRLVGER